MQQDKQQPDPSEGWLDADGKRWFRETRYAVWYLRGLGPSAKLVALRLVEHGANAFPSIGTLALWTELSERTVRTALRTLEEAKVITTRRTGRSSRYSLFCEVRIPELGAYRAPPVAEPTKGRTPPVASPPAGDPSPNGVPPASVPPDRQNLPISSSDTRSANFADQIGNHCLSDRQPLPPKQGLKLKGKRERGARDRAPRPSVATPPPLFVNFDGWTCSPELRAELIQLGIPAEQVDLRINSLKIRPINRGKGVTTLDGYVREQAQRWWVAWEAERIAKANSGAGNAVSSGFGGGVAPAALAWEPSAAAGRYCKRWGLDLSAEAAEFRRRGARGGGAAADLGFKDWLVLRAEQEDDKRNRKKKPQREERASA